MKKYLNTIYTYDDVQHLFKYVHNDQEGNAFILRENITTTPRTTSTTISPSIRRPAAAYMYLESSAFRTDALIDAINGTSAK